MRNYSLESISIRKLIILALALPLVLNLIFINVFFSANREMKKAHEEAIRSKEKLAEARFLMDHLDDLKRNLDQNFNDLDSALKRDKLYYRSLAYLEEKTARLLSKTQGREDAQKLLNKILSDVRRIEALPKRSDFLDEAAALVDLMNQSASRFLTLERQHDLLHSTDAKSSIDFEFELLISALIVTIFYFGGIIYLLRKSFFNSLDRILNNLEVAEVGGTLNKPKKVGSELFLLENGFYNLYRKLQERNLENEGFVYCVSHDLRSPLLNIQSFGKDLIRNTELIEQDLLSLKGDTNSNLPNLLTENRESLTFILASVKKITQIIESVLGLSRAGRIPLNLEMIDLNKKLSDIVNSIESSTRDSNASILVGNLPEVCSDRTATNQIFLNLLTNSLKYRDKTRKLEIEIGEDKLKSDNVYKAIYVRDNGMGIPENYLERIFLPFEQIKSRGIPGEGLGLSIVKKLIERVHGQVEVSSVEGEGTVFTLYLKATCHSQFLSNDE